ncbi:hypothetical protein ACFYT3_23020 [Nocardia amikacinitolerans]|uniref:hypothetical protein n=1 Tax=Nocardia amikacinitolerans TaxID=756689 RepID=UPI0036CD83F6|nr:hypothetical protein [Nocardia amikacinitolerans]
MRGSAASGAARTSVFIPAVPVPEPGRMPPRPEIRSPGEAEPTPGCLGDGQAAISGVAAQDATPGQRLATGLASAVFITLSG